ncbi:hypothetical protein IGI04_035914 [Brassica rapa subsp. trilocularis]|uniref:Uncharacterized protein n=1 Tax=Brassica rapa subsp. trilocularis TaxID=1813537 RepID=A0ABQ7LD14_BRACM|nr:hypothetical protein IGI04_035914 [Brassica rapa subsp. trilocularis]
MLLARSFCPRFGPEGCWRYDSSCGLTVVVYLSLWDEAAAMFRGLINSSDRTQSVMVVEPIIKEIVFNSTPITKFYFDTNLQPLQSSQLGGPVGEAFPCTDSKEYIKQIHLQTPILMSRNSHNPLKTSLGKDFIFQIRETPYNFTPNHRTFTAISDHINQETFNTNEAPVVEGEGGQASASASKEVVGDSNEPNPFGLRASRVAANVP